MSDTVERVIKIARVNLLGDDEKDREITESMSFTDDLGADSLDTVELVMAFEEEFGIEISDEEANKIGTIADAASFIDQKRA